MFIKNSKKNGIFFTNKRKSEKDNCCNKIEKNKNPEMCKLNYCYISTIGVTGPTGPQGDSGILNYADFYALMPPDNAATVALVSKYLGHSDISITLKIYTHMYKSELENIKK